MELPSWLVDVIWYWDEESPGMLRTNEVKFGSNETSKWYVWAFGASDQSINGVIETLTPLFGGEIKTGAGGGAIAVVKTKYPLNALESVGLYALTLHLYCVLPSKVVSM